MLFIYKYIEFFYILIDIKPIPTQFSQIFIEFYINIILITLIIVYK